MAVTLVNGRAYSYVDVTLAILNVPTPGISAINYTEEQDKTNEFGTSTRPTARGRGVINASGSLEISMDEVEALRDVAPSGSLLLLPAFDIVVVFGNPGKIQTHVLEAVEFLDDGVEMALGDTEIKRTFGLVISNIRYR